MKLSSCRAAALAAAVLAFGFVPAPAVAASGGLIVFGDDLSDQGNSHQVYGYPAAPAYYAGRFSDGPNWIDDLGLLLGAPAENSLSGGTNYAFGEAVTGPGQGVPAAPFVAPTIVAQAESYLHAAHGRASASAQYVIFGGGIDSLAFFLQTERDPLAVLELPLVTARGSANVASVARTLVRAGAKHVLILNLPDVGLLPIVHEATGLAGWLGPSVGNTFAKDWNAELKRALRPELGGAVTLEDFYNVITIVNADASKYGISDTTTACLQGYGVQGPERDACTATQESTHAFWDEIHFTRVGYLGMAEGALCALGRPSVFGARSNCVVTPANAARSAQFADPAALRGLVRSALQRTSAGR